MAPWLRDYRQRWGGPALAVVQPDSTADVAAVVRWCVDHDAVRLAGLPGEAWRVDRPAAPTHR